MSTTPPKSPPQAADDKQAPENPVDDEPGTNAVQHEPDPKADALPDGERKYHPRSPYTGGSY